MPVPQNIQDIIESEDAACTEISLANNGMMDEDIIALVALLQEKKNPYIKNIDLTYNNIRNKGAEALARLNLEFLDLTCNNINDDGVEPLAKSNIRKLNLCHNNLTNKAADIFIKHSKQLKLDLVNRDIDEKKIKEVNARIEENNKKFFTSTLMGAIKPRNGINGSHQETSDPLSPKDIKNV